MLSRLAIADFHRIGRRLIAGVVVLILLYSGWKGGDLVCRHGIGSARRRLAI